jgi:putative oxidoreductase
LQKNKINFVSNTNAEHYIHLKTIILAMFKLLFKQQALWSNAIFFLRIWVGIIFVRYGLSLFHNINMLDFADTLKTANIPFPGLSAYLCKATEFFGGLFLILGFMKRILCFFLIIDMFVATFIFHKGLLLQNGMTTFLLLICCLTILLSATDKFSIDWLGMKYKMKNLSQ